MDVLLQLAVAYVGSMCLEVLSIANLFESCAKVFVASTPDSCDALYCRVWSGNSWCHLAWSCQVSLEVLCHAVDLYSRVSSSN